MKAKELFDMGKNHAEKLLIERGHIVPQMLIHVSMEDKMLDVVGMPIHDEDSQKQDKMRANVLTLVKASKKRGIYQGSLMVSEAWMAVIPKDKFPGKNFPRAKDDPNRIEVVIISAWGSDGDKFSTAFRITGEKDNRRMGEEVLGGTSDFESWMNESL
jgi:hypothetical protein